MTDCAPGERGGGGRCDCRQVAVYSEGGWNEPHCYEGACYMRQENGCGNGAPGDGTWCYDDIHRDTSCPLSPQLG